MMGNFKWGARPEYRRCTAPTGCSEIAVCRRSERCIGCPFPATGFICWGNDDDCMKTRIENSSIIAGPFFVVGEAGDDFRSLTDAEVSRYLQKYAEPHQISQKEVQADMRWTIISF